MMKQMTMALILWRAFSWSHTMAQTQEQGHKQLSLPFIFSSSLHRSFSLLLPALPRRDSTSPEFAIHVGTPRRGNSHRINTMYAARSAMNHNQSGIDFVSFLPRSSLATMSRPRG
jgi:hypothetical protein